MPDTGLIGAWAWLIVTGIGFGLIAAAPIGAVNIICIRRTLHYGPINGFLSGTGAALGDAFFAFVTSFGFTQITDFINEYSLVLEIVGGAILVGYGSYAIFAKPKIRTIEQKGEAVDERASGFINAALSTLGLTLINPATLLFFAAVMASLASLIPAGAPPYAAAGVFVGAVLVGSLAWWAVIVSITWYAHRQIGDRAIVVINRVTGAMIGVFGLVVLANALFGNFIMGGK